MIETVVHGDLAACHSLASSLTSYEGALDATIDTLTTARSDADGAWDGLAAELAAAEITGLRSDVHSLQERAAEFRGRVTDFADSLTGVRDSFAALRSDAAAAGLAVSGQAILPPDVPPDSADDAAVTAYHSRVTAYNALVDRASAARTTEGVAHERVTTATQALTASPVIAAILEKLGFLPGSTTPWGLGTFALGGLMTGGGWAASYLTTIRYGTFKPRHPRGAPGGVGGRYVSTDAFRAQPWYRRAWDGSKSTNYQARQGMTAARGRWNAVGRWTGRLGVPLTVATSAVGQWREDSDDPSMGTPERVTRTATQGATTGAGAWAGGLTGAKIGAGLGSLAGPAGTVVGGIVGGLVGGVVGAGVGEWVGDQLVDAAGDVGEFLGDAASDAGDAIGRAWDGLWD